MKTAFDPNRGLIVVSAQVFGPVGDARVRLAVDTGATSTLLRASILVLLGYDPAVSSERVQVTTGSGVEFAPRSQVKRLAAMGQVRENFPMLSLTLPPSAGVDGLLGLDFFRGGRLVIDFRHGQLSLR